jgi:hypothetical protein
MGGLERSRCSGQRAVEAIDRLRKRPLLPVSASPRLPVLSRSVASREMRWMLSRGHRPLGIGSRLSALGSQPPPGPRRALRMMNARQAASAPKPATKARRPRVVAARGRCGGRAGARVGGAQIRACSPMREIWEVPAGPRFVRAARSRGGPPSASPASRDPFRRRNAGQPRAQIKERRPFEGSPFWGDWVLGIGDSNKLRLAKLLEMEGF